MVALSARRHRAGRWARLGLLVLALAAAPGVLVEAGGAPGVEVSAPPAGSDLLYLQPRVGITADALTSALARLGWEPVASSHREGVRVRVPAGMSAATLAERIGKTGLVRSVEADALVRASGAPNDPLYLTRQRTYLDAIRAAEAWAAAGQTLGTVETPAETGGATGGDTGGDTAGGAVSPPPRERVLIAVIDTGVDFNHPDLADQFFVNEGEDFLNGRDDDDNGCVDDIVGCNFVNISTADPSCGYRREPPNWRSFDDEGHGTFVAGVAAAAGNNEVGVAGIAWDAQILPVKVLDCTATGRISDAAAGIRYAATMGADVINISFGTTNDSPALREAVRFAQEGGAIIVASAGNDDRSGVTYPALYPGVLSVAASGLKRGGTVDYTTTAEFARFGGGVDLLAPGVDLMSTVPASLCGQRGWECVGGAYAPGTGSSFATPLVAGAVAMLLGEHPGRSPGFIVTLLMAGQPVQLDEGARGARLLDIAAAMQRPVHSAGVPGTSRRPAEGPPPGPGGS